MKKEILNFVKKSMKNSMKLEFEALSENEGFARMAVASFFSVLDPTLEELAEIKTGVSEGVSNCIIHGYEAKWGKNKEIQRKQVNRMFEGLEANPIFGNGQVGKEFEQGQICMKFEQSQEGSEFGQQVGKEFEGQQAKKVFGQQSDKNIVRLECAYDSEGKIYILISDSGKGIEDIEKARSPLFTTGAENERAGMGFTVMESFMDTVEVTSELGVGTEVFMTKKLDISYGEM